ncbi:MULTISPECIES: TIGR03089 family protein [unclassified Isoptericola]|uniref:TIGR03089 family protein n=1 Tax=unclassified Isoptericola TaxID=2623355 RepID=UPI002713980B|nr:MULTISPECIES: TIGR03089 family protein [unclassified Isoptericola]MDO8144111.1 TIGR03089 family protein [Isoptericola sp. 178]MDO8147962.1 TIGR03089 family protein [Isoptericola sp. b515]MDO8152687.1 TIGR03089 family protein [Isoptericola sp. b408]
MTTPDTTATGLLARLTALGGRPALTWYGDDGERIELSGAVVDNWVAKTVNLLVEEFDTEPGSDVVVDLPVGWRQVVWALAAARCGADVALLDPAADSPDRADADVVVTSRPDAWTGTDQLVAVALPALARRFEGELPPGAVDAAGAVMTYGDAIVVDPAAGAGTPLTALAGGEPVPTTDDDAGRVLVRGTGAVAEVLAQVLTVWAAGGSVVLTSAATAQALDGDPERLERLVATEQITRA